MVGWVLTTSVKHSYASSVCFNYCHSALSSGLVTFNHTKTNIFLLKCFLDPLALLVISNRSKGHDFSWNILPINSLQIKVSRPSCIHSTSPNSSRHLFRPIFPIFHFKYFLSKPLKFRSRSCLIRPRPNIIFHKKSIITQTSRNIEKDIIERKNPRVIVFTTGVLFHFL